KVSPNLIFGLLVLAGAGAFPDGVTPTLARWGRRVVRVVDPDERFTAGAVPDASPAGATDGRDTGTGATGRSGEGEDAGGGGRAAVSARPGPVEAPRGPGSSTPSP